MIIHLTMVTVIVSPKCAAKVGLTDQGLEAKRNLSRHEMESG